MIVNGFVKTLKSDIDVGDALQLFEAIKQKDDLYSEMTKEDLQLMCEVLSILRMPSGEKILAKGEEATFCGIVMEGTFTAIVSDTITVDLTQGALVGEMALVLLLFKTQFINCLFSCALIR